MTYKIKDLPVFATLITATENFISENECIEISKHARTITNSTLLGYSDSISQKHNSNVNESVIKDIMQNVDNCETLENRLLEVINDYTEKVGLSPVTLTNSWINIQKKGSTLLPHRHPGHTISGTLYLKVDSESSPIIFSTPNPFTSFYTSSKVKDTLFNYENVRITPKNGVLVLFPSWLLHSGGTNNSEERIALSFNASER